MGVRKKESYSHLTPAEAQALLDKYDETIGKALAKNIFVETDSARRFPLISEQVDVPVANPPGPSTYTVLVNTVPLTAEYVFQSFLTETILQDGQPTLRRTESKVRPITFAISQAPFVVYRNPAEEEKGNDELLESEEEEEEEDPEEDLTDEQKQAFDNEMKLLGKSYIYSPKQTPTKQFFIRKLLYYDYKYGADGIRQMDRQQQQIKSTSTTPSSLTQNHRVRIRKIIPVEEGLYIYEIYTRPPGKRLHFKSQLKYFVFGENNTLHPKVVLGSQHRHVELI
jgi:hypothetical protein